VVTWDGAGRLDFECDDVSTDYFEAGRMQVRHLVELGRRRLCLANTFPSCHVKDRLLAGARRAAAEAGLEPPMLVNLEFPPHGGSRLSADLYAQVRDLLRRERGRIDGFVGIDLTCAAAVRAAIELGIRVPEELAIVGFDDSPTASNSAIPITTVAQSAEEIGRSMFELLARRIERPEEVAGFERRVIQPTLMVGESTRRGAST
jgi:LacI family transcriptional regulator